MPFGLPSAEEQEENIKEEYRKLIIENELLKRKLHKRELEDLYDKYRYARQDVIDNCSIMYSGIIANLIDEKLTSLNKEINSING